MYVYRLCAGAFDEKHDCTRTRTPEIMPRFTQPARNYGDNFFWNSVVELHASGL